MKIAKPRLFFTRPNMSPIRPKDTHQDRGNELKHGCETVADAPFARPFGIPDGFIAAGMYGLLILLALIGPQMIWVRYSLRTLAILAARANVLGVFDMTRLGAYCFIAC